MRIKSADDKQRDIAALHVLLARRDVPAATRDRIDGEIRRMRAGVKGEEEAAYQIDFNLAASKNWMVIHDLRLEIGGRVANIDHLILDRLLELWVCETKSFAEGVAINSQGEWERLTGDQRSGMPSPIEQNKRHMAVLRQVFEDGLVRSPKRLGVTLRPELKSLIVVSSSARIVRPDGHGKIDGLDGVVKCDQLSSLLERRFNEGGPLQLATRVVRSSTIETMARQLTALHRPLTTDWAARFGLSGHRAAG